ncbi:phosphoenolpyruvate carboxykinase (ATP) [bacterium]|nr:phosphoenolpyruvate carboxykinase (ATP) [bacterium]
MSSIMHGETSINFDQLIKTAVQNELGVLNSFGVFVTSTGKYTGRATKQRYFLKGEKTGSKVDWGIGNVELSAEIGAKFFKAVKEKVESSTPYTFKGSAGPFDVEVSSMSPWHIAFCANMFRSKDAKFAEVGSGIKVWHAPYVKASDLVDGYNDEALILLDLENRQIAIAGTSYAGEIKKSVFTTCNFWAPEYETFPMHASANCLDDGTSSCVLFGLSGTGKTTLSASPDRALVGDDEIMWDDKGIYNLEGGCYAKLIDLKEESEPEIFRAVHKSHAIMENVVLDEKGGVVFTDRSKTENTRGSYPLSALDKVFDQSKHADSPKHVVFLTADAFGALPPVALLDEWQAQYMFISGYTAKVAGTELGVKEPQAVFSACFGAPFMPRPPAFYAKQLVEKVKSSGAKVWLLNTGWTQGGYGVGERFPIKVSRGLLSAIQNGMLEKGDMQKHPVFGFQVPVACHGVDAKYMTLGDVEKSKMLDGLFRKNFEKFKAHASPELLENIQV